MTEQLIPPTLAAVLLLSSCTTGDGSSAIAVAARGTTSPASAPAIGDAHKGMSVVMINGSELTEAQLDAFKAVYGTTPAPGRWWYDADSGMFGAEGEGATGFMYAGHDLGPLAADASRGDAPVFINGRRLTTAEADYLARLSGGRVEPGRYWVDAQLNWGLEGAADAAGNLHDDSSPGYVSIPGAGPIGSDGMN